MVKINPTLLLMIFIAYQEATAKSRVYMCYFEYGGSDSEKVYYESLDYYMPLEFCTHVIQCCVWFDYGTGSPSSRVVAADSIVQNGEANAKLKAQNPNVKFLISVIGAQSIIGDSETRSIHIREMQRFLNSSNMDGIDLQLTTTTHSCFENVLPKDPKNFAQNFDSLLDELRSVFPDKVLMLSMYSNPTTSLLNFPHLTRILNFINLKAYKLCLYQQGVTAFQAPIYASNDDFSVDSTVRHLLDLGVRKNKLVMSVSAGTQYFPLLNPEDNGLGAPVKVVQAETLSGEYKLHEMCGIRKKYGTSMTSHYDSHAHSSYFYYRDLTKNDTIWLSSDTKQNMYDKGLYVSSMRLAGVSIFEFKHYRSLNADYCRDSTAVQALHEALKVCPRLAAAKLAG